MPSIEDQLTLCRAQLKAARDEGQTNRAAYLELRMDYLLDQMPRKAATC